MVCALHEVRWQEVEEGLGPMGKWVLIFYLTGAYGGASSTGGPGVAYFDTALGCEKAALAVVKRWDRRYEGHICVKNQ